MGQCKHHPQSSIEGVCSSCLQKKLKSVRFGETVEKPPSAKSPWKPSIDPVHPKEAIAILGSIASIKKRNHRGVKPGRDITEAGLDFVLDSRYTDGLTSFRKPLQAQFESTISTRISVPGLLLCPPSKVVADVKKDRKQRWLGSTTNNKKVVVGSTLADSTLGSPLVDRIAKETALRVIREVKDDSDVSVEDVAVLAKVNSRPACFSPSRWRSKWGLKGIGSPMNLTSSNKVFPSKSTAEAKSHFSPARDQSRVNTIDATSPAASLQQQAPSSDRTPSTKLPVAAERKMPIEDMVIVGMPDRILKPEDMTQRLRTSYNTVLQWLEDLPVPDMLRVGDPEQDPYLMDIRNSDAGYQRDSLAVVGHLHEIAEEHEILDEESSVEEAAAAPAPTGNHLDHVSSFGKFLIRAAQRQPKQGLSRVQARA